MNIKQELYTYLDDVWDRAGHERTQFWHRLRAAKYICLFGAGQIGQTVANDLADAGIRVDFFCDNNGVLWGKPTHNDILCLSIETLEQYKDDLFILVTTGYFQAVCSQLESRGFGNFQVVPQLMIRNNSYWESVSLQEVKDNLGKLIDSLEDERSFDVLRVVVRNWFGYADNRYGFADIAEGNQYFPNDLVTLSEEEVFVDVGAFTGDTLADFLTRTQGRFSRVVAYELDRHCYGQLQDYIQSLAQDVQEKIDAYNLGLYDVNRRIGYVANTTSSSVKLDAGDVGEVVRLADHLRGIRVTYIKMDIEGAEVKALEGAEELIKEYRPRLAICVYHQPSHLWEVPLFIKNVLPDHKICLRHHTDLEFETVCYAVPR